MLFFSFNYLIFYFAVFILYYLVNNNYKYYVLFAASLVFVTLISLKVAIFSLLFTSLNYFLGIFLERFRHKPVLKGRIFWLSILIDVGFLIFFKYINFLIEGINAVLSWTNTGTNLPYSDLVAPIGISYYTFQSLGYLVRIKRGNESAEKDFIKFALLLLFFPKFLSGPIERSNHFLPQIKNLGTINYDFVLQGLRLFLWGAFKKIVIANNLYEPVSRMYNNINSYTGNRLIFLLVVQTIYIYTEFSGYTDMALGSAKIFGIDLIDNFNRPFLAKSVTEFWKRWHISLSSWCNDFIYYPFILKFRKWEIAASVSGVFLTFLVIGIWHGSNWTFIVLGLLQGAAIVYEFYTKRIRLRLGSKLPKGLVITLSRMAVFLFAGLSLIFFFSRSIADAWYFISHLFSNIEFIYNGYAPPRTLLALVLFILLFVAEIITERGTNLMSIFLKQKRWVRWSGYYVLIALIYFFNSEIVTFVYMKF
jgi:alginate O-acetyltransferase complex protein AlgI